jgi:hypothetical protein
MQRMWCKIIQYRLVFLVGVLVTAVLLVLLVQAKIRVVSEVCAASLLILMLSLLVASLAAINARHPATFLVREGAFTTAPSAYAVLSVAMLTALPLAGIGLMIDEGRPGFGPDRFAIGTLVLVLLLLPLHWYGTIGPFGVFLRPDGVLDRQLFGSIFVPWDAGPAAEPTGFGVKLRVARPDLVVRHGWRPGTTIRTGADRGFTAWALNLYTARPDYRATIGTDDGLRRLESS